MCDKPLGAEAVEKHTNGEDTIDVFLAKLLRAYGDAVTGHEASPPSPAPQEEERAADLEDSATATEP